ncbi:MAG: hypothetical protein HQL93_02450 [Magnetococcales bacterium]|nr:hypothetical protein [Magnetococcales bacterium]
MARPCSVCIHKRLEDIDKALVEGETFRALSRQYLLSRDALRRHKMDHLPVAMAKAKEAEETSHGDNLLDHLGELREQAQRIAQKAEEAKNYTAALAGVRELVRIVELLAKLRGELNEAPTVNLFISAEWVSVQAVLVNALGPYPEARQAVLKALDGVR